MPSENILTRVFGANDFAISEVVHVTADKTVARAQADVPGNLTGAIGLSLGWTSIFNGVQEVLLEAGLVPVAGEVLYVSATQAGRGTNVPPLLARGFATILDASRYADTGTVVCVLSDAPGGGGAAAECCPSGFEYIPDGAAVGPVADGVTDHTYVLAGATGTVNLPPSNAANLGRRITVNFGSAGVGITLIGAPGVPMPDTIRPVTGGGFVSPLVINPGSAGGPTLVLLAQTWVCAGNGVWELYSNHVYAAAI